MPRIIFAAVVALVFGLPPAPAQSAQLEERSILGGKVDLLLPVDFALMDEEMLQFKYPYERRPTIVYTNPDASVNVAVNHTQNPVELADIPELHKAMEALFQNLYPSAEWFSSGLIQIDGKPFFMLDLRTPAVDTEIRNLMIGTSFEGRILLFTFNTTRELETTWVPIGNKILKSIRISE